jgi:hypothetical protein
MEAVSASTESHNRMIQPKMEAITWHVVCREKKAAYKREI